MPYKVIKTNSEYCVHKENADGSVGEKVACHETKAMADDQVKALYASEADKATMMMDDNESDGGETSDVPSVSFSIPEGKGLYAWADYVRSSWDHEVEEGDLRYSWVNEIFSDYVIVTRGYGPKSKNFKVPYTVSGDEVEFDVDNKQKVELKVEWVQKMFKSANGFDSPLAVKALAEDRVGAYGIIWSDGSTRDSDGQYFDKNTKHLLDVFNGMGKIPYLVHHAADGVIKSTVIGEVDTMIIDDTGLWYEAKILQQDLYKKYVAKLVDNGKAYSSSGALPAAVKATKSGYISHWPIVEMSCTWTPSEYRMMSDGYTVEKLKSHFNEIGIDSTELFADENETEIADDNGQDAEEAAVVDGSKELFELAQEWLELQKLQVEI